METVKTGSRKMG